MPEENEKKIKNNQTCKNKAVKSMAQNFFVKLKTSIVCYISWLLCESFPLIIHPQIIIDITKSFPLIIVTMPISFRLKLRLKEQEAARFC